MKKAYIYGAGQTGKTVYQQVKDQYEILGFMDNDETKWGGDWLDLPILNNSIPEEEFDEILIGSLPGMHPMREHLLKLGLDERKINTQFVESYVLARERFLRDYAELHQDDLLGYSVAEGGVLQGDFAEEINRRFPNNKLYLFDTFEGFDARDMEEEKKYSNMSAGHLNITSTELVMSKMKYPSSVIIKKGYFPDTTVGLENEEFVFINMDFDVYKPTLEGLKFFFPRMVKGSVMLIHDYFSTGYPGVEAAVRDYERNNKICLKKLPIGDGYSIAIIK